MKQGVERAASRTGEVRTHVRTFSVQFVAHEAGASCDFVAGIQIHWTGDHHPAFSAINFNLSADDAFTRPKSFFGPWCAQASSPGGNQRPDDARRQVALL